MTSLDYQISLTKNTEEEDLIISNEKNVEIDLNENNFEKYHDQDDDIVDLN